MFGSTSLECSPAKLVQIPSELDTQERLPYGFAQGKESHVPG